MAGATRTTKRIVPLLGLAVALLSMPAAADLVGLYTFDRANPLEAVIGSPAKEGVMSENNAQPALSDTMSTITLVADADVLGARTGVVAVPSKSTLAIPNPGLAKDWTIVLPFYCPDSAKWRCFFKFDNSAGGDGSLFINNDTDIGAGSYTTGIQGIVGAWHQLTVSSANGTQTIWYDQRKLDQTRDWNIAGLSLLLFSFDNDGEDALMYLDDIRLYDETAPAEVFPDGTSGAPAIFTPYAESPYEDDFATFSRTPDRIIEDPPYRTYVFERHGSFTFLPVKRRDACSALFVGGGGAGGLQRGGGGGGGGVVSVPDLTFLPQFYTATVGAGGIPAVHTYWYQNNSDTGKLHEGVTPASASGGDTTLVAAGTVLHVAHGGGGGGNFNYSGSNKPEEGYGLAGASGGGSSGKSTVRAEGIDGEGHAGGAATTSGDNFGGGGGGAGSAGVDGAQNDPGVGGDGVESSITGTLVVYGGGGGAGGGYNGAGGVGGAGGGGTGVSAAAARTRTTAANGTDGLGGGGGGGSGQDNNPFNSMGGRGGDGAMILRVLLTSADDPAPALAVNASDVGFTNATFDVHLLSLGSGADWASVTLRLSVHVDMSDPFFTTNLAAAATAAPDVFATFCSPLAVGTAYYVQATATNNLGVGGASAIVPFATPVPGPTFTATVNSSHIAPAISLDFTDAGWGEAVTRIMVQVSATGDFTNPDVSKALDVNLSSMPATVNDIVLTGLPTASPLRFRLIAENSSGYENYVDLSVPSGLTSGDNVWSGLSEDIDDPDAYIFAGGLPEAGKKLFFTSPAGLSPVIDQDTAMPSLRFTSAGTDAGPDSSYLGGYHSCGYDFSGSGVLTFTAEKPIWHGTKGTNVIENPILFNRSNSQTVYVSAPGGRLDLTGELMLPSGVSNTTMRVNGDGGEVHFGGPSSDFMGTLFLETSFTLSLDSPNAMTNVSQIYFGGGWGSFTYLKNNTGAPMTFPRCTKVETTTGWSSTRACFSGAPMLFPNATLIWYVRAFDGSMFNADVFVRDLVVGKNDQGGDAGLDKNGTGTLAVSGTTSWSAQNVKHYIRLRGGCFWARTPAGLPPSGEFFVPDGTSRYSTLGLNGDYSPMLDGSSTPRVFQESPESRWGFTGFGGDRTVCWNKDSSLNLTNTTSDHVTIKLTDATTVNSVGNTYDQYYAYPARFMFGNRSEFADGTILFLNPIRYELGQNWDTATYFESTNHVVAARMRGSLKLGNRDKTWNFSGRNFGGYLALEAENTNFTGRVNVYEKGNLLVNSNLVARSVTVQSGCGLGGTGSLSTEDGTTVKSGGALFGGEWDKGGTLTLGGKLTMEGDSTLRVEVGASNDRIGCVKLAAGSVLKLGSTVYVDVDTDPRVSPVRSASRKILDWSEASFDSGSAPTRENFVVRPELNHDLKKINVFVRGDGLYVGYATVRCPVQTIITIR